LNYSWRKNPLFLAISMNPSSLFSNANRPPRLEVYYDPSRLPLPDVVGWLDAMGIAAVHRTPQDASPEWLQKYGCCFPWVVADGRMVLKAGFQRSHLERLAQRWFGTALVVWLRTPKRVSQELSSFIKPEGKPFTIAGSGVAKTSRNLQVWETSGDAATELSALLLESFRQGWRPILLGTESDKPPADAWIERAIEQLKQYDIVIARNQDQNVVMFGTRAWHGELFQNTQSVNQEWFVGLVNKAKELGLAVAELDIEGVTHLDNADSIHENEKRESRS
jgi:hypothetical protein